MSLLRRAAEVLDTPAARSPKPPTRTGVAGWAAVTSRAGEGELPRDAGGVVRQVDAA